MILDSLANISSEAYVHGPLSRASAFLKRDDLRELADGTYPIVEDEVFAVVVRQAGKKPGEAELEAHDDYLDIHLVLEGEETMGWSPRPALLGRETAAFPEKDLYFYSGEPEAWFTVTPGNFAVFYPEDGHLPMISEGAVHKVIVKIRVRAR